MHCLTNCITDSCHQIISFVHFVLKINTRWYLICCRSQFVCRTIVKIVISFHRNRCAASVQEKCRYFASLNMCWCQRWYLWLLFQNETIAFLVRVDIICVTYGIPGGQYILPALNKVFVYYILGWCINDVLKVLFHNNKKK